MSLNELLRPNNNDIYLDSLTLGVAGGSAISKYEELTIASTATGIWASPLACTLKLCRVGASVSLYLTMPAFAACTVAATISFNDNIPTRFLPPGFTISAGCQIANNGINSMGLFTCSSAGVMRVYATAVVGGGTAVNAGSNFIITASGTGFYPISASWVSPQTQV